MEVDLISNTDNSARSEQTGTQEIVDESCLTEPPSCPNPVPEMTSAELPPLDMSVAELAPLQAVKLCNVTTVEVSKNSTNVNKDETLINATYPVYVKSLSEADDVLHRFENDTKTRYSVWRCPKDFGNSQIDVTNKRIYWQEFDIGDKITVKSDGVPFIMMGRKVFDCHFGKDRNVKLKEKLRLQREEVSESTKARKTPPTRKLDCPAKVVFCEIIYFPDFKISSNTKYYRGVVAKKIKESFAAGSVNMQSIERRIYISFPTSDEHTGHPTSIQGTSLSTRVDPKISKKLSALVLSGIRNEKEMKEQLDTYITRDLYPGKAKPFRANKRYFPNTGVIRMKMFNELVLQRLMLLDCVEVDELVERIQNENEDDKIYTRKFDGMNEVLGQLSFNLSVEELLSDEIRVRQRLSRQQFIFVHQTSFQRHLLKRYGDHVCFLDPVYRTVKYPLPLFFLMVKTNVDYQVVATFVVQDENMESTKEALEFIKTWNPEWKPKVFMVDNDSEEITSVQECFPECKVLLSDFHREQAWEHWLSQSSNGVVAHKNAILVHLRRIAHAKSEREFEEALELLKHTDCWQCDYGQSFRLWFEEKWLSIKERWVLAYQKTSLCDLFMTNFTVEHQKKDFAHEEVLNERETSLSFVLKIITAFILPANRNFYMEQNVPLSKEEANIPSFYHMRPRQLTEHTAECMTTVNEFTADDVVLNSRLARGEFVVKSSQSDVQHEVHFGNDAELPHCECQDWSSTMLPCKHFLVVMQHFKNWNWSSFPERYRSSPYFALDSITDQNSAEEDPMGNRTDTSVSRRDPSESRADQSGNQSSPHTYPPDTSRINPNGHQPEGSSYQRESQPDPSASRLKQNVSLTVPSGDRTDTTVSRSDTSINQESIIPPVSLHEMLLDKKPGIKSTATECRDLINNISNLTYLVQDKTILTSLYDNLQEILEQLKQSVVDDDVSEGKGNKVYPMNGRKRLGNWSEDSVGRKLLKVDEHGTMKVDEMGRRCRSEISEQMLESAGEVQGHCRTMNGSVDATRGASIATVGNVGDMNGCGGTSGSMNSDIGTSGGVNVNVMTSETSGGMNGNAGISRDMDGDVVVSGGFNDNVGTSVNTNVTNGNTGGPEEASVITGGGTVSGNTDNPRESIESSNDPLQLNGSQSNEKSGLHFSELGEIGITMLYSNPAGSLSKYEERLLTKQEEIAHSTVNLAQDILRESFPDVKGLQTVARGPIQTFEHVSGDFIQILHDGYMHWTCVSNVRLDVRDPAAVNMYDSMNQGFIAKFTKQQLASFMCIQSAEMKVIMKSVQQQTSHVDCGVFAIAFATALAFGHDPSKLRFDVLKMRPHLVECLKLKKMSPFPEMKPGCSDIVLSRRKFYTVELFCSCRMPYEKPKNEADLMAQCSVCSEWFHERCDSLKSPEQHFVCRLCLRKVCS